MAAINNLPDNDDSGQEPTGPDSDEQGSKKDIPDSQPTGPTFPYPNLDEVPPGNQALSNARILLIGSMVISHLLVGYPPRSELKDTDLVQAGRYLWLWYIALSTAKTTKEFIRKMAFLLHP